MRIIRSSTWPAGLGILLCLAFAPPIAAQSGDLETTVVVQEFTGKLPPIADQNGDLDSRGTPIEELSDIDRERIERMIDDELTELAAGLPLIEGQTGFDIKTRLIPGRRLVLIEFGTRAIPVRNGVELEDQQHQFYITADELLRGVVDVNGFEFRYGGKNILDIFPDPPPQRRPRGQQSASKASPKVAVSGGHGLYFNYEHNDWRPQRPLINGMREDFVTPYFARDLATQLTRQGATVYKARTNETHIHTPTGEQWWRIGARYHLAATLPEATHIWHSLPKAKGPMREHDEDLRSRPLYANHVGADYVIHLHTNAAASPSVRGTRGYYHTGRVADAELTRSILCGMKQTIRSVAGYESWTVMDEPNPLDNKGENRLAEMPSTIIELGFHTNADDARALQQTAFRNAAVKGIERGISDHHAGNACTDFRITEIPSFSAPAGTPMDMVVHFEGNPRFPVTLRTRNVSCSQGWSCGSATATYSAEQDSPITRTFACGTGATHTGNFTYVAWLTDASGIKTPEFQYTYSCTIES